MRIVIARCSVDYVGRLTAHLPSAQRLLIVKADGSVLVHSDGGSYKPLNWMSPPCRLEEGDGTWRVVGKHGEELRITLEEVLHDSRHELGTDPGLVKDGVEAHLQELLAEQVHVLGEGWRLVRREYPTAIGPVDLMCRDPGPLALAVEVSLHNGGVAAGEAASGGTDPGGTGPGGTDPGGTGPGGTGPGGTGPGGTAARNGASTGVSAVKRASHVAVEVKRVAGIDAVEQLSRYLELLNRDPLLAPVRGVLAAQSIRPQARTLAEDRGIRCVLLDYDRMRGVIQDNTLF